MITQDLTKDQHDKIGKDLQLISLVANVGKDLGCRAIIAGGYAVDAALGQITRPHNDIDIQLYSQDNDGLEFVKTLLGAVAKNDPQFVNFSIDDKVHKEYYRNLYIKIGGTIADVYYIQTKNNPFDDLKIIVKKDGSFSEPHHFETKKFTLNGVEFEGQDPLTEIVDKIYKRDYRDDPKLERHEQDIDNLKAIVPSAEIDKKLEKYKR
jgi:hypothetical protein